MLVTVSAGVLKSGMIQFKPAISDKINAVSGLGFGGVIKMIFHFKTPFWKLVTSKDLSDLMFLFSDKAVPTWWTDHNSKQPKLTGWIGGPNAEKLKNHNNQELTDLAFKSLSESLQIPVSLIEEEMIDANIFNWLEDVHFRGDYSYEVIKGESLKEILRKPVQNRVYFAGEALYSGPYNGTVEAALSSGRETAQRIIAG